MSKSFLTAYEMMHIPCPSDNSDHSNAEQGNCALNIDGKCIFGGMQIGGKCYTGLMSTAGQGYHDPGNPGAVTGPHKVWYTDNHRYSGIGGQGAGTNAHWNRGGRHL